MGFRGTLWRPDPQTVAALRRGKSKIERSGLVLTETQAKEKSKARGAAQAGAAVLDDAANTILAKAGSPDLVLIDDPANVPTDTLESDRQFGQPHYGHAEH